MRFPLFLPTPHKPSVISARPFILHPSSLYLMNRPSLRRRFLRLLEAIFPIDDTPLHRRLLRSYLHYINQ